MIEISIPVYNEDKNISKQVKVITTYISQNLEKYQPIFLTLCDNGSTDQTKEIIQQIKEENPQIKYLYTKEKGIGWALKNSWKNSDADIIGYMDLDFSTDLTHLKDTFDLLENNYDLVSGSRLLNKSKVINRSILRSFISYNYNLILKIVFKNKFSDGACGFKFMKRSTYNKINNFCNLDNGFFFTTQLLIISEFLKIPIYDLPVKWTDDKDSKIKIIYTIIEYFISIYKMKKIFISKLKNK